MRTDKPILLLEDDEVDVMTVRRALQEIKVNNELIVAANGEEGLCLLRGLDQRSKPCIILLDLNMPRMTGLEFLRVVRREGLAAGVPVIVLTTSRQDRDIVEGFHLNVAGYMIKPVHYREFLGVLKTIDHYWTVSELPR
jgi:DNA-binding response OmpR family regulator